MTRARNKSKFVWVLCCLEVQYKKVSSYSEPQTLDVQIDEVTDDMARNMGIVPQPLSNPRNHCYINSCLQVSYHIFMHYTEDVHFNNNREGYLVKGLVEGIYSDSRVSLSHLKQQ